MTHESFDKGFTRLGHVVAVAAVIIGFFMFTSPGHLPAWWKVAVAFSVLYVAVELAFWVVRWVIRGFRPG